MTTQTKSRGFTIVELLIVIVIIAILAAITIVAYTGITNRANAATAKSNAESVAKVAAAYAADDGATSGNGNFPTLSQLTGWTGGVSRLPTGVTVNTAVMTAAGNKDGKTIFYAPKSTTGGCIGYWDATKTSGNEVQWMYVGDATAGVNATTSNCS